MGEGGYEVDFYEYGNFDAVPRFASVSLKYSPSVWRCRERYLEVQIFLLWFDGLAGQLGRVACVLLGWDRDLLEASLRK